LKRRTGNHVVPVKLALWCLTFYLSVSICINSLFCQLVLGVEIVKIRYRQDTKVASEGTLWAYQDGILSNHRTVSKKPC
jgi:hypothetical protein